jgi:allantoin racemase
MRILLMNVNTTESMTETMRGAAQHVAAAGTEILATQPSWGPASVEGYYESYISAAAILDRLTTWDGPPFDALIWAGFGEHGREGAQELLDVPVITITEAAVMTACLVGHQYGIVTTLDRAVPQIVDQLRIAGLYERCAAVLAADIPVLGLEDGDEDATTELLAAKGREAIALGAEALCLGCGGMAGMAQRLSGILGVPVVDGIEAAVKLAEACVSLGLRTSKVRAYGTPLAKARPGWPVTR